MVLRFDTWPELIGRYERSKTYESIMATFDEVERRLKAHVGPLPVKPKSADRLKRKQDLPIDVFEEGAFACFDEE